jgi:hypothetical protein
VPLNGESPEEPLSPEAVEACVDYVRSHRRDPLPFDVVVNPFGGDPEAYERAGATWWIGGVGPDEPIATASARIGQGPPR